MYRELFLVHTYLIVIQLNWICMFYVVVWNMLIRMLLVCLYGRLVQLSVIWELYFINSHEGLIFMLVLDIMLFPLDYLMNLWPPRVLFCKLIIIPMKGWLLVDLVQQIKKGYVFTSRKRTIYVSSFASHRNGKDAQLRFASHVGSCATQITKISPAGARYMRHILLTCDAN